MSGVSAILLSAQGAKVDYNAALSVDALATTPSNAQAGVQLENDGDIAFDVNTVVSDVGDWVTPKSAAGSAYECRVTETSGTLSNGTTGTWLSLGTTRAWNVQQTVVGVKTCTITLEIRLAATGVVKESVSITLTAEEET